MTDPTYPAFIPDVPDPDDQLGTPIPTDESWSDEFRAYVYRRYGADFYASAFPKIPPPFELTANLRAAEGRNDRFEALIATNLQPVPDLIAVVNVAVRGLR